MADVLRRVFGLVDKRFRDMGDGTHAEVMALGGEDVALAVGELADINANLGTPVDVEAAGNGTVIAILKRIRTLLGTPAESISVTGVTVDVTLTLDTNAYHAGDVLAATQEVANVARASGTGVELVSLIVRDKDDQTAAAMSFFFFDANVALGTENAAPDISDANADALCGMVTVPASAWVDLGGVKVANMESLGRLMHPATGTSLYMAVTTAGTPTQSASGITVTLQFIRY